MPYYDSLIAILLGKWNHFSIAILLGKWNLSGLYRSAMEGLHEDCQLFIMCLCVLTSRRVPPLKVNTPILRLIITNWHTLCLYHVIGLTFEQGRVPCHCCIYCLCVLCTGLQYWHWQGDIKRTLICHNKKLIYIDIPSQPSMQILHGYCCVSCFVNRRLTILNDEPDKDLICVCPTSCIHDAQPIHR